MAARILVLDIETQRAIVEVFDLWAKFIHIDRVRVPARVLCYSAKWIGEDMRFKSAWDEDEYQQVDPDQYERMLRAMWKLLDEADYVITWNGDRFDLQWLEEECGRLGLGKPSSYKSIDLIKVLKRRLKAGLLSMKLDWSARMWLHDQKTPHGATDLWHDIRWGTQREKREACALMREYCEHDTELTERLFERYRPWIRGVNVALFDADAEDLLRCPVCNSNNLKRNGFYPTTAFVYQRYRCKDCGSEARGKRNKRGAMLRPVA